MNSSYWPTKENRQTLLIFFARFRPMEKAGLKWPQMGPGVFFFLLIQTLPTFWATRILILRIFILGICLDPKFLDFQVPDFQISRNLAWAQLGPSLGPGLGPGLGAACARAWARLGPGLGPAWARAWARAWALAWAPFSWAGGPLGWAPLTC